MTEPKTIERRALDAYYPPFRYDARGGYIWDAMGEMVADNHELEHPSLVDSLVLKNATLRVRGWGRLSYLEEPAKLQDAIGEHIARALTEYWRRERAK